MVLLRSRCAIARSFVNRAWLGWRHSGAVTDSGMAEGEISILDRQCLGRRLMDRVNARREVNNGQHQRNAERRGIDWTFPSWDADRKLARHNVS